MRSYRHAESIPANVMKEFEAYDSFTQQLLYTRGIESKDEAVTFLNPNYETGRHDPFLLPGMEQAIARILRAIAENEKIVIYSDYDCDGIPGAVVLHDFFYAIGFTNSEHYIPHRHYEGFGLSVYALEKIRESKPDLLITIDCGTADVASVQFANENNIDVIVTDHHVPLSHISKETDEMIYDLPLAYAVVNPKIGNTYPFPDLCGAGVVFKLVEALIARGNFDLKPGWEKWWLDMVGIATISDMVPLTGENRIFARFGLDVLRKSRRPGIQHLLRTTRTSQRHLTEDDIGFTIGPRINAASRMDTPEDAFHMLAARDEGDAGARVAHLEKLNKERRGIVGSMTKELKRRITDMIDLPEILVLGNTEWRPSLVGLAANSLAETYNRPAFIWGRDGNGIIKGSCRSDGVTSVVTLMNSISDFFIEHGGHHMSGGFAVKDENIFSFPEKLNEAFRLLGAKRSVQEEVVIDATLTLDAINESLLRTLAVFAPFGIGNPKPLFEFKDVVPEQVIMFGKAKEHLKLIFNGRETREALAFFAQPDSFRNSPVAGKTCTLLAHVEQSFFMGRMQTRLRIVDIL
ncbi:MAG: single-stranded-DNA-specific exonuclease RecJ [Candidatus Paceibacterota bacterium]